MATKKEVTLIYFSGDRLEGYLNEEITFSPKNSQKQEITWQQFSMQYLDEVSSTTSLNQIDPDSFRVLRFLGEGGFAKVYLVEQRDTLELFALKKVSMRLNPSREKELKYRSQI